jgi:hypothetical protein
MAPVPADADDLISAILTCRGTFGNGRIPLFAPFAPKVDSAVPVRLLAGAHLEPHP